MRANRICNKCRNTFSVSKIEKADRIFLDTSCPRCGVESTAYQRVPAAKASHGAAGCFANASPCGTDIWGKVLAVKPRW